MTQQVVTYEMPGASQRLNICPAHEKALMASGNWPRGRHGEYSQVYYGLHEGHCEYCGVETADDG